MQSAGVPGPPAGMLGSTPVRPRFSTQPAGGEKGGRADLLPQKRGKQRGVLLGIATKAASRASMQELPSARISVKSGVGTDARGWPGKRQVTILTRASWEAACAE